ncbi:MAG: AAA family ATPase [Brasilonema octagenarum HA4186-MV1]|jgi:RecA/RadA recombinase|nr:AAA family ATPase [Brasilonema octagenarum HA4186-MV1]
MATVKLSDQGKEIVDDARRNKGFNKNDQTWADLAHVSVATLIRCQNGIRIDQQAMVEILRVVEVPYDKVVEKASIKGIFPDTTCYGRTQELADLKKWVTDERCRVVTIYGAKGIGKTTVARQLVKQVKSQFKDVYYLRVQELQSNDEKLTEIMTTLQQNRYLVVLDGWESLFQGGKVAGTYRDEYTAFTEFLKKACEINHSSCLLVTSLEEPKEVIVHNGHKSFVKSLHLKGLDVHSAITLFQHNSFSGNEQGLEEVIQRYGGNPLLLTLVAKFIRDTYGGSVKQFLKLKELAFGDIRSLLEEQYARLSPPEKYIIVLFAFELKPFSGERFNTEISRAKKAPLKIFDEEVSPTQQVLSLDYLGALASLKKRSLIEVDKGEGEGLFYSLHPYLMQYAIQIVCIDIYQNVKQKESNNVVKRSPNLPSDASDPVLHQIEAQVNSLLNSNLSSEDKIKSVFNIFSDLLEQTSQD